MHKLRGVLLKTSLCGLALVSAVIPFVFSATARASVDPPLYTLREVVQIPNYDAQACYDIASVAKGTLYLADDTNRAVDVISGIRLRQIGTGLFQGPALCHSFDFSKEGPTGVLIEHGKLWVGDGDSTVKVFRLSDKKLLATIPTGPSTNNRADELDYIPLTNQVVVANPDAPAFPYLTYIDASTLAIVAKQPFKDATAGLEQPRFAHWLLYQALPATTRYPGGEIDAINPVTRGIVKRYPTGNCGPSGLVILGPLAATGCANGADEILNLNSGKITVIADSGAADMVAVDPVRGHFFFASYAAARTYVTNTTGTVLQAIPTDPGTHSVAVDPESGTLYIPVGSLGGVAEYVF